MRRFRIPQGNSESLQKPLLLKLFCGIYCPLPKSGHQKIHRRTRLLAPLAIGKLTSAEKQLLSSLNNLTPVDFHVVSEKISLFGERLPHAEVINALSFELCDARTEWRTDEHYTTDPEQLAKLFSKDGF